MTSMYGVGGWRNRGVEVGCVGCEIRRLVNVAALKPTIAHGVVSLGASSSRSRRSESAASD